MRIGIVDADLIDKGTRHPNLALMKLSGWNKEVGNEVSLLERYEDIPAYDKVYIGKVFSFTRVPENLHIYHNIQCGGTGFYEDGGDNLPDYIEHHMPDYNLYNDFINKQIGKGIKREHYSDYLDYSIGFMTRGCFRRCSFCVNKKYDHAFRHAHVKEFLDETRPKIYLWDDNVLAYSKWKEVFEELIATGRPFQFRQGMDIRLMTEEKAEFISRVKYHGDFIFAFDHIEDKKQIEKNLRIWKKYCKKTTKLYVLVAYDSQDIRDIVNMMERIKILMKCGCIPYVMRYEAYKSSEFKGLYIQIARWCNQPRFYKKMSFRQFCEANQKYHKNPETICSTLRTLRAFEHDYPDIAAKYFDLRFEDLRML